MPLLLTSPTTRVSTRYRCEPCNVTVYVVGDERSTYAEQHAAQERHARC